MRLFANLSAKANVEEPSPQPGERWTFWAASCCGPVYTFRQPSEHILQICQTLVVWESCSLFGNHILVYHTIWLFTGTIKLAASSWKSVSYGLVFGKIINVDTTVSPKTLTPCSQLFLCSFLEERRCSIYAESLLSLDYTANCGFLVVSKLWPTCIRTTKDFLVFVQWSPFFYQLPLSITVQHTRRCRWKLYQILTKAVKGFGVQPQEALWRILTCVQICF